MKNKYVALLLGWLVPGLGHWYAGKRWKGVVLFCAIIVPAAVGLALGRFHNLYFAPTHYQFYAELGNGAFALAATAIMKTSGAVPIEKTASGAFLAKSLPIADLYLMVAGLLNYVAAANAFDLVARQKKGKE